MFTIHNYCCRKCLEVLSCGMWITNELSNFDIRKMMEEQCLFIILIVNRISHIYLQTIRVLMIYTKLVSRRCDLSSIPAIGSGCFWKGCRPLGHPGISGFLTHQRLLRTNIRANERCNIELMLPCGIFPSLNIYYNSFKIWIFQYSRYNFWSCHWSCNLGFNGC